MALDDMIETSWGRSKGKGSKGSWGRGDAEGGGWGRDWGTGKGESKGAGKGDWSAPKSDGKAGAKAESKLDMSLDEVIETLDLGWWGNKGGKGQAKSGGCGSNFNSWGRSWPGGREDSSWTTPGGARVGGCQAWAGKGASTPQWMGHDDWRAGDRDDAAYDGGRESWQGGGSARWDSGNASSWRRVEQPAWDGGRANGDRGSNAPSWRAAEKPPLASGGRPNGERTAARPAEGEWQRGTKRGREETETSSSRGIKKIKVTNIPRNLEPRDIKEAFEAEAGKTVECKLERGVAIITFQTAEGARKAVANFDRGELNGHLITVTLVP